LISSAIYLDVAKSRTGIGNVLYEMGKHEEALVQHQKALEVFLAVVGHNHLDVAVSCRNIASVYLKQGKRAQANEMATKAYDINLQGAGT
jgi:tetratricopeptide (TPR) repeat protein